MIRNLRSMAGALALGMIALSAAALSGCATSGGGVTLPPEAGAQVDTALDRADRFIFYADAAVSLAEASGRLAPAKVAEIRTRIDQARQLVALISAARTMGQAATAEAKGAELARLISEIARTTGQPPPTSGAGT